MNNYHNPYRNPYPGQGMRYGNNFSTTENGQNHPGQEHAQAGRQESSGQEPPKQEHFNQEHATEKNPGQEGSGQNPHQKNQSDQKEQRQNGPGWQNDPSLKNMDLKKLAFLSELVAESGNKPLDALLPFLVSANKNANSMGLQFNDAETSLLLEVLKKHMSPEEQSRIDLLRKMADILGKK